MITNPKFTIPESLGEGTHYIYCEITDDNGNTVATETVKVVITSGDDTPTIPDNGQPVAPSGDNPVGNYINVNVNNPGHKYLAYQWKYSTEDSYDNGTPTGDNSNYCTIPNLPAGTYYFWCEITDENGTTITQTRKRAMC